MKTPSAQGTRQYRPLTGAIPQPRDSNKSAAASSRLTPRVNLHGVLQDVAKQLAVIPEQAFSLDQMMELSGLLKKHKSSLKGLQLITRRGGRTRSAYYNRDDLEKVLIFAQLIEHDFSPQETGVLFEYASELKQGPPSGTLIAGVEYVDRLQTTLQARLLGLIAQLLFPVEYLRNGFVIVQEAPNDVPHTADSWRPIVVADKSKLPGIVAPPLGTRQAKGRYPAFGGEVIVKFTEKEHLDQIQQLPSWPCYVVQVPVDKRARDSAMHVSHGYLVAFFLRPGTKQSDEMERKIAKLDTVGPTIAGIGTRQLLPYILNILLVVARELRATLQKAQAFRENDSALSILANAVIAATQPFWDYATILTTDVGSGMDSLRVGGWSTGYSENLVPLAHDNPKLLTVWTYRYGEEARLLDTSINRGWLIEREISELHPVSALALPTTTTQDPNGVLFLAKTTIRRHEDDEWLVHTKLARVFAAIAGEWIERERMTNQIIQQASSGVLMLPPAYGTQDDLQSAVASLVGEVRARLSNGLFVGSGNLTLVVSRVVGVGTRLVAPSNPDYISWAKLQASQLLHEVLEQLAQFESTGSSAIPRSAVYHIGSDGIIGLLDGVGLSDEELRRRIGIKLAAMEVNSVKPYFWTLHFPHRDLIPDSSGRSEIEIVDDLVTRAVHALQVVVQVEEANHLYLEGSILNAVRKMEEAHAIDSRNTYVLRHLSEWYAQLGRVEEARSMAQRAVDLEPSFEGTHRRKAEALFAAGLLGDAISSYEKAISYNPQNGMAHVRCVRALMLRFLPEAYEQVVQQCDAVLRTSGIPREVRALAYLYSAQALEMLYKNEAAKECYRQALETDPRSPDIAWELLESRYRESRAKLRPESVTR